MLLLYSSLRLLSYEFAVESGLILLLFNWPELGVAFSSADELWSDPEFDGVLPSLPELSFDDGDLRFFVYDRRFFSPDVAAFEVDGLDGSDEVALHESQTYVSGTLFLFRRTQDMWSQLKQTLHSIMRRPLYGLPQKHVITSNEVSSTKS